MYYDRLDADVTRLNPLVVIKANYPRDKVVAQHVKIVEVKEDDKDSEPVRSEVSRALPSLEQEVHRSGRSMCQTTDYNPTTSKATELSTVQYFAEIVELDNEELSNTIEV